MRDGYLIQFRDEGDEWHPQCVAETPEAVRRLLAYNGSLEPYRTFTGTCDIPVSFSDTAIRTTIIEAWDTLSDQYVQVRKVVVTR